MIITFLFIADVLEITLDDDSSILLDSFKVALAAAMSSFLCGSFKSYLNKKCEFGCCKEY